MDLRDIALIEPLSSSFAQANPIPEVALMMIAFGMFFQRSN